jgi:hypothetical protein
MKQRDVADSSRSVAYVCSMVSTVFAKSVEDSLSVVLRRQFNQRYKEELMKTRITHTQEEPLAQSAGRESAQAVLDDGDVRQRIAVRAYELYRERGGSDGRDLDDWLEAERAILLPSMRRD